MICKLTNFHSLKCSCICIIDFLLWNTKEDILKNVHTVLNDKSMQILQTVKLMMMTKKYNKCTIKVVHMIHTLYFKFSEVMW